MIDFFKKNKKYVHSVLFLSTFGKSLCADEENDSEPKKEPEFRKEISNGLLDLIGNVIVNGALKTKDLFVKDFYKNAAPYIKLKAEAYGKMLLNFNKDGSDDIFKKIETSGKFILFNSYFIGSFIKNGINGIQDLFCFDDIKFSWAYIEKQLNDNLNLKSKLDLNYGSSEYVKNDDLRVIELRDTVELKTNLGGQEFKFDPSLGLIFTTDNNTQAIRILKKTGDFAFTRLFSASNMNTAGDFFLPSIGVKCNVDHDMFIGGLRFYIDPIVLAIRDNSSVDYLKWDLLLDFSWKKDLSIVKNLKGNIAFGFDSDMSFFFNDKVSFTEKFKNDSSDYILFRPHLVNINASCDIDFTSLIKNVDKLWFVSNASTGVDLKFEVIFGLTTDFFGTPVDSSVLGTGVYFNFTCNGLKTKLNGANIENEKLKLLLDNLKIDLLKFSLGVSPKTLKVDTNKAENNKFDELGFDWSVTLAKGEFNWDKYGLIFNTSILGDDFGSSNGEFNWNDIISVGCKWNFAKFWENRNN